MRDFDVSNLLTVAQALDIVDRVPVSAREADASISDAMGLHLAQAISADRDDPPFDKALMDGFAVRCDGLRRELDVIGTIAAGNAFAGEIGVGQAAAIMTGAPIPRGADAVVPVEETTRVDNSTVRLHDLDRVKPARSIARRGSDCASGTIVLQQGTRMGAPQIAVAASVGASRVRVFARPRVAILTSGDEIVRADAPPGPSQIRNSNGPMLVALLTNLGCEVIDLGIVRDDPNDVRDAIASAVNQFDVTFMTGGMSMGEFDYVPRALQELDVDLKITKLRIKPGKPFVFGVKGEKFVFGLPGNPVSAFVCTLRLASRLIARLMGAVPDSFERWTRGPLTEALPANGAREFYLPAIANGDGSITPLAWNGSADIYTLARAEALIVRAENENSIPAGGMVKAMLLRP